MPIGKNKLTQIIINDNYFESLLDLLIKKHTIDDNKRQQIMFDCLEVFNQRMYQFTGGDSSVSKERGQSLMDSILFTISYALKKVPLSMATKIVITKPIKEIYQIGLSLIKEDMLSLQQEIANIQAQLFVTKLQVYNDTILQGLLGFLKTYNFDYTAQDITITADYLTTHSPTGKGIEFIKEYVKNITIENTFLCRFSPTKVHLLLQRHHPKYQYLIINISEIVLLEIIGLLMLNKEITELKITNSQRNKLKELLEGQDKQELLFTVQSAYNEAMIKINMLDQEVYEYFYQCLPECCNKIYHQIALDKLEIIFL